MIKLKTIYIYILMSLSMVIPVEEVTAQVINAGVGGNSTMNLLARIDKDVLSQKPDLVILMVGTNDMLNSKKMISYQGYRENYEQIVLQLKESGTDILLMSAPPVDSAYLFERHDRKLFEQAPNSKIDSARKIVEVIAGKHKTHFLDLNEKFKELSLPKHNEDLFIKNEMNSGKSDGVHPTALGYQFIATNIYQYLRNNDLIGRYKTIICFGDSITNGGGSNKKNYPNYLSQLLSKNDD